MSALVSVVMPCYNSAGTLPMALASLLAQTYESWECVLVDDGSTDHPERLVEAARDPRIRYIRLKCSMGRGYARQTALENARGDFIAFLDADDWWYPWKLQRQFKVLNAHPGVALLSAGMAIVGRDGRLGGVRRRDAAGAELVLRPPLRRPQPPPVAFAPSLARAELARKVRFDPALPLSEDADFLLRLLMGRPWASLPDVLYAYTESASATPDKVAASFQCSSRMFLSYTRQFPLASRLRAAEGMLKAGIYRILAALGAWQWAISRRSMTPSAQDRLMFDEARRAVAGIAGAVFATVASPVGMLHPARTAAACGCSAGERPQ